MAYITDYITKTALTTHGFFETVRAVLSRNSEILNCDDASRGEAARSLIVKIVNALSGAAELGGPAVCAYLLGNPDHYTSEIYKVIYWKSYLRKVKEDSPAHDVDGVIPPAPSMAPVDRVMLGLADGDVVPLSKINDYVFRPEAYSDQTLYEFLTTTDVKRVGKKEHFVGGGAPPPPAAVSGGESSENGSDDDEPVLHTEKRSRAKAPRARAHQFATGHPQHSTHGVYARATPYVLNFVGGALPRPDRGDRDEYCTTMLTLFHPGGWRTGNDLRATGETWSAAFERVVFKAEDVRIMKNMNILYECLDARDDFSAQRREAAKEGEHLVSAGLPAGMHEDSVDETEDHSFGHTEDTLMDLVDQSAIGPRTAKNQAEMMRMRKLMLPAVAVQPLLSYPELPGLDVPRQASVHWKRIIGDAKQAALDKMNGVGPEPDPAESTRESESASGYGPDTGVVAIVSKDDLNGDVGANGLPRPLQDASTLLLHSTIKSFTLNEEQTRAFSIAAHHLQSHNPEQLLMHLSGMAGTGKSRVIHAIMSFLDARDHHAEICATNGAEAVIVDWHAHLTAGNRRVLDVLFVELVNPPHSVKLPGLPPNVIPLTRMRKSTRCTLPIDDMQVSPGAHA
ncbi:hypothetical protein VTO73DRAFT_13121 [Trametes versicolor]